jgi:uncharacterized RDD family membrane protein YckC
MRRTKRLGWKVGKGQKVEGFSAIHSFWLAWPLRERGGQCFWWGFVIFFFYFHIARSVES